MPQRRPAFPAMLRLDGKSVVVVGGGEVATRKVRALVLSGALPRVIALDLSAELVELQAAHRLIAEQRPFRPGDLQGATLAFAATNVRAVNAAVREDARRLGIPINVADAPDESDFHLPAVARNGEVEIFVSSSGASPALARLIRERIEQVIGPEYDTLASLLRALRPWIKEEVAEPQQRRSFFEAVASVEMLQAIQQGTHRDALKRLGLEHGIVVTEEMLEESGEGG